MKNILIIILVLIVLWCGYLIYKRITAEKSIFEETQIIEPLQAK